MADREKLIELLCESKSKSADDAWFSDATYAEQLAMEADHLIAHGVTLDNQVSSSKWIPVTERLPEMRGDGFADAFLVTDGYFGHLAYFVDGEWFFTENGEMKEPMFYDVTHWMPLPTPPKGE